MAQLKEAYQYESSTDRQIHQEDQSNSQNTDSIITPFKFEKSSDE